MIIRHKAMIKRGISKHQPKPGRNRPAKGYDPITKTWRKEK